MAMGSSATEWVCLTCGHRARGVTPGARCPIDGRVLVTARTAKQFGDDPFLGRVIAGRYALYRLLGRGGMGAVYRAVQEPVGREVALKLIRADARGDPEELRARFFREARVLARLDDPGVVTLHDYGEEDGGLLYMALELVRGRSLSRLLRREGRLPVARSVDIARQVLHALAEPHAQGLVHRDIKPANIMVRDRAGRGDVVKLIDFGVTKALGDPGVGVNGTPEADPDTDLRFAVGTPRYLAPEVLRHEAIGPWTDQYAVGVVLYRMLTGAPPFPGPASVELLAAHLLQPVPPMPPEAAVPPEIEAVVRRALAKDPAERWPADLAMADALTAALESAELYDQLPTTVTRREHPPPPEPAESGTSHQMMGAVEEALSQPAPLAAGRPRGGRVALAVVVALSLVGGLALGTWVFTGSAPDDEANRIAGASDGLDRPPPDAAVAVAPSPPPPVDAAPSGPVMQLDPISVDEPPEPPKVLRLPSAPAKARWRPKTPETPPAADDPPLIELVEP